MTLRKYKKLLMSHGIDRDQAEEERKYLAKLKRWATEDGADPAAVMLQRGDVAEVVSFRKSRGTTSRRSVIKYRKELIKSVTLV